MFNPVSTSRVRAVRALTWQGCATLAVALLWWVLPAGGVRSAVAALAGGGLMVFGGWVAMLLALGGGIVSGAQMALGRVVIATLLKWGVVAIGLLVLIGILKWPPLPVLSAVILTVFAYIVANAIPDKVCK